MRTSINFTGISNNPSVYSSADGVMSHLVNFIPENEELKVVGKSKILWYVPPYYKLLYIHNTRSEGKHYIFLYESTDGNKLYYQVAPTGEDASDFIEIGDVVGTPKIVSIGNTLIAYSQDEMRYFLWKNIAVVDGKNVFVYRDLGTHLPELNIDFALRHSDVDKDWSESDLKSVWNNATKILFKVIPAHEDWAKEENQKYIEDQICALANTANQLATYYGNFVFPFFVRYAYRLFDGSTLTMHSAPVLMLPSTNAAMQIISNGYVDEDGKIITGEQSLAFKLRAVGLQAWVRWLSGKLYCRYKSNSEDFFNWADVIQSVDIFVSAPIYTYKQTGKDNITEDPYNVSTTPLDAYGLLDPKDDTEQPDTYGLTKLSIKYNLKDDKSAEIIGDAQYFLPVPQYDADDIEDDVKAKSQFYLLKSLSFDADGIGSYGNFKEIPITKGYLSSLVNKEVMTDDYDSHDTNCPGFAFVYNSRLNITNIIKKYFRGWSPARMCQYTNMAESDDGTARQKKKQIRFYSVIKTDKGSVVKKSADGDVRDLGYFLYYPNATASSIVAEYNSKTYRFQLESHDFLNGAFYVYPFWNGVEYLVEKLNWSTDSAPVVNDLIGELNNKVYTSEANMPFFFPVTGINTVGNGEIYALTTTTQALSEGQFGQYPLYAFTNEGTWALAIGSTGGISSVTPVTRDICTNPESIMQLDDSAVFITDRGLMLLSGSHTQCLSETLNGDWFDPSVLKGFGEILPMADVESLSFKSFGEFAKDAFLAYDFPRQRILVCNPSSKIALAYSLKSLQWGQATIGEVTAVANSYPNCVLQIGTNIKVIDPSGKTYYKTTITDVSQESKTETVKTLAVTRPFSFGDKDMLKTVNDVIVRGDNVGIALYGSRDLKTWHYVGSCKNRFIRGLQGSPYKSFRLVMVGEMTPSSMIVGASFEITPKDDNILR